MNAPPTKRDGDHDMSNDETVTGIILARLERIEGKLDSTTP